MTWSAVRLDEAQQAAVFDDGSVIVVRASAGSGKTEVLAQRVERIVSSDIAGGRRVLCLSYTNRAAGELRDRFADRLGDRDQLVETSTIHAFAHDVVQRHGTWLGLPLEIEVLTNDTDRLMLFSEALDDAGFGGLEADGQALLRRVDLARARCENDEFATVWKTAMTSRGVLDYQALIDAATELLELDAIGRQIRRPYGHILVDEAHNLTPAQDLMLRGLIGSPGHDGPKIMLVGEPDQALVDFAGGDGRLMLRFVDDFDGNIHRLELNYRSARRLVVLASAVKSDLDRTAASPDAPYGAAGSVELQESPNEESEANAVVEWAVRLKVDGAPRYALADGEDARVMWGDIAILARSGAALRHVRAALETEHVPVSHAVAMEDWMASTLGRVALALICWRGGSNLSGARWLSQELGLPHVERDEAKLLKVIEGQASWLASAGRADEPGELFGRIDDEDLSDNEDSSAALEADRQELLASWRLYAARVPHRDRSWPSLQVFLSRLPRETASGDALRLGTIHSAQGREFKAVAVVGLNDGQLPDFRAQSKAEQASELRAFYVAVSRPTRLLLLTRAQSRQTRYGNRASDRSPYLAYVEPLLQGSGAPRVSRT